MSEFRMFAAELRPTAKLVAAVDVELIVESSAMKVESQVFRAAGEVMAINVEIPRPTVLARTVLRVTTNLTP